MLDPKLIRTHANRVKKGLLSRGYDPSLIDNFLDFDEKRREQRAQIDQLKNTRNKVSDEIGKLKAAAKDASSLIEEMKNLSSLIKEKDENLKELEEKVLNLSLLIPNLPHESVPLGPNERANCELRKWGEIKNYDFVIKSHDQIGKDLGILDFSSSAKIAGSGFSTYMGIGAQLERALINFMLDRAAKNGYSEVLPPHLANRESMQGSGQLPKFSDELFKCPDDNLYLIPTAEVSLTNLYRDEIISAENLPLNYAAYTPCYRREAGSYGKDTRGLIRVHQFNKVELYKFVLPENSYEELERLTIDAEEVLKHLELPYRVALLSSGDLGFCSAKTYDLEVWFPSENNYREVSSCSNCEDFQARRANIRFRRNRDSKPEFVHTLNGSGLAVGRTFAAILENYQTAQGHVVVPKVLREYLRGREVI